MRASSVRVTLWPTKRAAPALLIDQVRREQDAVNDALVAGAATDVPGNRLARLRFRWPRVLPEQLRGRHHEARGAEAALETVAVAHRLLQVIQVTVNGEALDRCDLRSGC